MASNSYDAPFYKPPKVATPYTGNIQPGQIELYKDNNWKSQSLTIDTNSSQYPEGFSFLFSGTSLENAATWIAFNLPPGTVCTLFNNGVTLSNSYNFAGEGICVDLIGNGQVQTVDLVAYGANDVLSGGIWRQVDASEGWFQIFSDSNSSGPFNTIFFAEWTTGTVNSLDGWWINKKASSINYPCLTPPQLLMLTTNTNGTGAQLVLGATNAFGSFAEPATVNLTDRGMNDNIQAFKYSVIQPEKAVIQSVTSNYTAAISPGQTVEESISGTNATSEPIEITLQVAQTQTYTVNTQTTLQYSMSATVSSTLTVTEGIPDEDSVSGSITSSFTTESSESTSQSYTSEQSFQLGQQIVFSAPPQTNYNATASVSYGSLPTDPPIQVTTTGQFYYQQKLPGAVLDPATQLWVLRTPVVVNLGGVVGSQVVFNSSATPISGVSVHNSRESPLPRANARRPLATTLEVSG